MDFSNDHSDSSLMPSATDCKLSFLASCRLDSSMVRRLALWIAPDTNERSSLS